MNKVCVSVCGGGGGGRICKCVCVCVCVWWWGGGAYMWVRVCVWVYSCLSHIANTYINVCMTADMYLYVFVCVYMCVCAHILKFENLTSIPRPRVSHHTDIIDYFFHSRSRRVEELCWAQTGEKWVDALLNKWLKALLHAFDGNCCCSVECNSLCLLFLNSSYLGEPKELRRRKTST